MNRLLASLAIVSLLLATAVAVLWWRADHGHSDAFHLGANSATQTNLYTRADVVAVETQQNVGGAIQSQMRFKPFRQVMGWFFIAPCLWVAVYVRRRLLPRRPDLQLPASGGRGSRRRA